MGVFQLPRFYSLHRFYHFASSTLTPMHTTSWSQGSEHRLMNDYYCHGIMIQPHFNWTRAKECTVDRDGPGQGLSDSDGLSLKASSVFSRASSNDDDSSLGMAVSDNEDSANIGRIAFHVTVDTQVFEPDEAIPTGEAPFSEGHSWPPSPMFQYAHSSSEGYRLTDAGERLRSSLTLHTPLYDSPLIRWTLMWWVRSLRWSASHPSTMGHEKSLSGTPTSLLYGVGSIGCAFALLWIRNMTH